MKNQSIEVEASTDTSWVNFDNRIQQIPANENRSIGYTINPSDLGQGEYQGIIQISGEGHTEGVTVELTVIEPPKSGGGLGTGIFGFSLPVVVTILILLFIISILGVLWYTQTKSATINWE